MGVNKWLFLGVFALLLFGTFFGLKLTPPNWGSIEKVRSLNSEVINIDAVEQDALESIDPTDASMFRVLKTEIDASSTDEEKIENWKNLSSTWYRSGFTHLSAYYAERIAELQNDEISWSIAGTSFLLALQNNPEEKIREYAAQHANEAFENAININPDNIDHKINKALVSVERPPADNPMTGVLQLVGLNKEYPNNVKVLNQLGRLALKTNQLEKASTRFESVLSLQPDNKMATCQLAVVYQRIGRLSEAEELNIKCSSFKK